MDKIETPEEFISLSAALEARDEPAYDDASATLLDALDWIAKALPSMKGRLQFLNQIKATTCIDKPASAQILRDVVQPEIDELTALIAQAEGKEVGG